MLGKVGFILYKINLYVQLLGAAMSPRQLPIALLWRRVERVEVLAVPYSSYAVQVIALTGRAQALRPLTGAQGSDQLPRAIRRSGAIRDP